MLIFKLVNESFHLRGDSVRLKLVQFVSTASPSEFCLEKQTSLRNVGKTVPGRAMKLLEKDLLEGAQHS